MPVETPPVATEAPLSAATTTLQPRAEEAKVAADAAAAEQSAAERVRKTAGFWNKIIPPKEGETKPVEGETKGAKGETETPKGEPKKGKGEKAEAQPPEPKEPPPEPEKPKRRKREEPDAIQIAEATGKAIAREMKTAAPAPVAAPARPEAEPELPDEFKRDVAVFEEMARQDPKRYGKIKEDLARYASAENKYIEKWEAEHPGETFDGDADEHNEFYERIKPEYDAEDFETAKTTLIENRAVERAKKEAKEEFQREYEVREQRREKAASIEPELSREIPQLLIEMANEAKPDGKYKEWAEVEGLFTTDRLLHDVLFTVHKHIKPKLATNMRVFRGVEPFDANNPVHSEIATLVTSAEERIQKLPVRDRYHDDGRMFATQADYVQMSAAEKKQHWYIGEEETAAIIRGQAKRDAKMLYQRERERFELYANGASATPKPQPATNGQAPKPAPTTTAPRTETISPTVGGRGTLPGDGQGAPKSSSTGRDRFFDRFLQH